jgi:hypothetical protein
VDNKVIENHATYHLIIYKVLKAEAKGKVYLSYDIVREILHRRFFALPKWSHHNFLKEMEDLGLIKRNGNTKSIFYELTGGDKDKLINQFVDII